MYCCFPTEFAFGIPSGIWELGPAKVKNPKSGLEAFTVGYHFAAVFGSCWVHFTRDSFLDVVELALWARLVGVLFDLLAGFADMFKIWRQCIYDQWCLEMASDTWCVNW